MDFRKVTDLDKRTASDILILPFWKGETAAKLACSIKGFEPFYDYPVTKKEFQGKEKETLLLYVESQKETRLLLVGLGEAERVHPEVIRRSYGEVLKVCRQKRLTHLTVAFPEAIFSTFYSAVEGMLLANYDFNVFKTTPPKEEGLSLVEQLSLVGADDEVLKRCQEAEIIVTSVNFARDLINGNGDDVTPKRVAEEARGIEKKFPSVKATVLEKADLEKEKMKLLLAVARGSNQDPVMVLLDYKGDPESSDITAIVGKGVTYDTGGLNIKPTGSMETMRCDMSGAAAVLGTIQAAAELKLRVNLLGVIPAAENGIGSNSYKPGDIYQSHDGKTVEIANTDAEGRLILADALSYIQDRYQLGRIIDLATLTGGIVVSLGSEAAGLFSNDEPLAHALIEAGEETHERLWRMPLYVEYKEALNSLLADMKNCSDRNASSPVAAVFLQQFIKKIPWAHIDIAGTAFLNAPQGYHTTQATGFGVRLLINFLIQKID